MAALVRNPYRAYRKSAEANAARRYLNNGVGGGQVGRPRRRATWELGGADPAEVAEEAGGCLAVPGAAAQEWWGSLTE
eukprot:7960708-Alexandrium_andersonii.AAC.1